MFNNIPLLADGLDRDVFFCDVLASFDNDNRKTCQKSAEAFYNALGSMKSWVPAVGVPMRQNLDQLGNAMSNRSANITLVTGMPGTGKENYMKSLHYAGTGCDADTKSQLVTTTALDMEKYFPGGVEAKFKDLCASHKGQNVTLIIDELNRAGKETRSQLLRVLENTGDVVGPDHAATRVRFIMAACDHLDQLARQPPKDFWTRITNQMRVSHPLGRVSEQDARDFLEAFFWYQWYLLGREWIGKEQPDRKVLAEQILGEILVDGSGNDEEDLAQLVCEEFVGTIAPAAMRDEISIRGLLSMMQQIFTNVVWSTRYGLVPMEFSDKPHGDRVRRSVNHAVQDVLAILNASRSTPRTSNE
ncbi:MAG: ATP-binding protein [Methylococcales bacterium]